MVILLFSQPIVWAFQWGAVWTRARPGRPPLFSSYLNSPVNSLLLSNRATWENREVIWKDAESMWRFHGCRRCRIVRSLIFLYWCANCCSLEYSTVLHTQVSGTFTFRPHKGVVGGVRGAGYILIFSMCILGIFLLIRSSLDPTFFAVNVHLLHFFYQITCTVHFRYSSAPD